MTTQRHKSEFPEHGEENRRIWDANARWWEGRPEIAPLMVVRMRLIEGS